MKRVTRYYIIIFLLLGFVTFSCSSEDGESSGQQQGIQGTQENLGQDVPKLELTSPVEGATVTMMELVRETI